jgi:hypothetical protein
MGDFAGGGEAQEALEKAWETRLKVTTEADTDAGIELLKGLEQLIEGKRTDHVVFAVMWTLARILVERQPDDREALTADLRYIWGGLNQNIDTVRLMRKSKAVTVN